VPLAWFPTLPVPCAEHGSRYTLLFEPIVISWLNISTVNAVRKPILLTVVCLGAGQRDPEKLRDKRPDASPAYTRRFSELMRV